MAAGFDVMELQNNPYSNDLPDFLSLARRKALENPIIRQPVRGAAMRRLCLMDSPDATP
jgi:hypothetical protein